MKTISSANEDSVQKYQSTDILNSYSDFEINSDIILEIPDLVLKINSQFDAIYKENKKRKYLLTEISNYLIKK
jgi:hypothetical protein